MKNLLILATMLLTFGFTNAQGQDKKTTCVYKPVGSDNYYKGTITYNVDKSGDPFVISFNIIGIENGRGDFYDRKEYPMFEEEEINGVTYKYSMPINGGGTAFFNMVCDKCR